MEFIYTSSIYIEENDIKEICSLVKKGVYIEEAIDDVLAGYGDDVYYSYYNIIEDLIKEIEKRIKEDKKNA